MAELNLATKGETIVLSDLTSNGKAPDEIYNGLGWDLSDVPEGVDFDLDNFVLLLGADGKVPSISEILYYGNKQYKVDGRVIVQLSADNVTGAGAGDDEWNKIRLAKLPANIFGVICGVNIFQAAARRQSFKQVKEAFFRVVDKATDAEMVRYNLGKEFASFTGVIAVRYNRVGTEWEMVIIGKGVNGEIAQIADVEGYS